MCTVSGNLVNKTTKHRVLLVTLTGGFNYGNRLQHYALKITIEKLGYSVTSLVVRGIADPALKLRIKILIMGFMKWHYGDIYSRRKRYEKLYSFNRHYIGTMIYMPVEQVRKSNWENYHCAVTGSDQVWHNWHWSNVPNELSYFYLDFMPIEKRISYAPSFGFTEFPEADIETHRCGLKNMRALSCREQEGCALIEQLTGRKAQKVLDPTLLLTAEEWQNKEQKPKFHVPAHYMIKFFLGEVSEAYQEEIMRISEETKLTIINLQDVNDPLHYGLSPLEFVWMIHHADVVCTDSFHASVFSILFERNLRVFERISPQYGNMFGRLHDLLEALELMKNVYGVGNRMSTVLSGKASSYLDSERQNSMDYLRRSLQKSGTKWTENVR